MQLLPHQQALVDSDAFAVVLAGPGLSGMTTALLLAAARDVHIPSYRALLLRSDVDALHRRLVPASTALFPALGAVYHRSQRRWVFPSGATIDLDVIDGRAWSGFDYHFIGFDRVEGFEPAGVDRALEHSTRDAWWRPPQPLWRRALLWLGVAGPKFARVPLRMRATAAMARGRCASWITKRFPVRIRVHVPAWLQAAMILDASGGREGVEQASGVAPQQPTGGTS
jgi:hypothetical protein